MKKVLFIHVPKTAGTTLVLFFKDFLDDFVVQANSASQLTTGDPRIARVRDLDDIRRILRAHRGLSLHVDSNFDTVQRTTDFRSLAWYLFEPGNVAYFEQFTILTMLRHPFRRFLSEYGFIRRMKAADPGFLPDIDVSSVETYLGQVHENPVLHFLLESNSSRRRAFTRDDLERVKERIAAYPIHVGVHEHFAESIRYFAHVLGRDFKETDLPALNVGQRVAEAPSDVESAFCERHALDIALYDYAVGLFRDRLASTRRPIRRFLSFLAGGARRGDGRAPTATEPPAQPHSNDKVLTDASGQNDLYSDFEALRATLWKRTEIGELVNPPADLCEALNKDQRIIGMWPDHLRLLVMDYVTGDDEHLRQDCLFKITGASLYPLRYEFVQPHDVDGWLQAHQDEDISHVVIVGSGTFVQRGEDFVLGVFRTISGMYKERALLAGHLIDRMAAYGNLPYVHEQFVILDLARWRDYGQPAFGQMYGGESGSFPPYRSSEAQIHDDYTPLFIVRDPGGQATTGKKWWGTALIASALEHDGKVINVPESLRAAKRYAYPNVGTRDQYQEVKGLVQQTLNYIHDWVYCFNNEPPDVPALPDFKPQRVISVAAGLKWISILRQYSTDERIPALSFLDYSPVALEYVQAVLKSRDREDLIRIIHEFSVRNPAYALTPEDIKVHLDSFIESCFSGNESDFFAFKSRIAPPGSAVSDFVLNPDGLLDQIQASDRTLFWHSNAWNAHALLYKMLPAEIEDNYRRLLLRVTQKLGLRGFRRRGGHLAVFGNSLADVHTMFTDGTVGLYSLHEQDWEAP